MAYLKLKCLEVLTSGMGGISKQMVLWEPLIDRALQQGALAQAASGGAAFRKTC
jgi:hypothetical protein